MALFAQIDPTFTQLSHGHRSSIWTFKQWLIWSSHLSFLLHRWRLYNITVKKCFSPIFGLQVCIHMFVSLFELLMSWRYSVSYPYVTKGTWYSYIKHFCGCGTRVSFFEIFYFLNKFFWISQYIPIKYSSYLSSFSWLYVFEWVVLWIQYCWKKGFLSPFGEFALFFLWFS